MDILSMVYSFIEGKIFPFKPSRRPDAIPGCSNCYSSGAVMEDILCTLPLLYELDNFSSEIMEDRLSLLPDDILVLILSKLTLREAVLTSSLSSRWRYLWMHVVCLNSNISEFTNKAWNDLLMARRLRFKFIEFCKKEGLMHINLINHALNLHRGHTLEEFNVSSPYVDSFKSEVDNWLKFASSKKVQHLKLVLTDNSSSINWLEPNHYPFPIELLSHGSDANCLDFKLGFKTLKSLTLDTIDVSSQVAKNLLSNCPLLEKLSIRNTCILKHLEIGPTHELKHLEIIGCEIDYLEICSSNLVTFSFEGSDRTNLCLKNVSSVVNLHIKVYFEPLPRLIDMISTKFTQQIVKLSLGVHFQQLTKLDLHHSFPKFNNLKWLILTVGGAMDFLYSFSGVTQLLQASPYLHTFEIKIRWVDTRVQKDYMMLTKQNQLQHLKVVRYGGYLGGIADEELIAYLLENCLALEKFIVNPCDHSQYPVKSSKVERRARSRAWRQLEGKVPKGVELVIL